MPGRTGTGLWRACDLLINQALLFSSYIPLVGGQGMYSIKLGPPGQVLLGVQTRPGYQPDPQDAAKANQRRRALSFVAACHASPPQRSTRKANKGKRPAQAHPHPPQRTRKRRSPDSGRDSGRAAPGLHTTSSLPRGPAVGSSHGQWSRSPRLHLRQEHDKQCAKVKIRR